MTSLYHGLPICYNAPVMHNKRISVLYLASGDIALPSLERLHSDHHVNLRMVISQPDRPSGRKRRLTACPVKQRAMELGCPVLTPEKIAAPDVVSRLEELSPDLLVVAAYGQYLPSSVLAVPSVAAINLHPSLLPKYRGATPIQMAVCNGETETGVTILHVSKAMDAGDLILQKRVPIAEDETAGELELRLGVLGAQVLMEAVDALRRGTATRTPQDESAATMVRKLSKEDGFVDWSDSARNLHNRVRGFHPWPGCSCYMPGADSERLKIHKTRVEEGQGEPGQLLSTDGPGPLIACGEKALRLLLVQPPGRNAMEGSAFVNGFLSKGAPKQFN